jgi:hypothetical protein
MTTPAKGRRRLNMFLKGHLDIDRQTCPKKEQLAAIDMIPSGVLLKAMLGNQSPVT